MTTEIQDWSGLALHVHHAGNLPITYCFSYVGRVQYIRFNKPEAEQAIRFERFQRMVSPIPSILEQPLAAYMKARAAHYGKTRGTDQTSVIYWKAWYACGEALKEARPDLIAIHERECSPKGCLWTPEHPSIFPGRVQL